MMTSVHNVKDAIDYYQSIQEKNIDRDYALKHQEALIFCYKNGLGYDTFSSWSIYEDMLQKKIQYEQYQLLNSMYEENIFATDITDQAKVDNLRYLYDELNKGDSIVCSSHK